jgi:hypothetical protein
LGRSEHEKLSLEGAFPGILVDFNKSNFKISCRWKLFVLGHLSYPRQNMWERSLREAVSKKWINALVIDTLEIVIYQTYSWSTARVEVSPCRISWPRWSTRRDRHPGSSQIGVALVTLPRWFAMSQAMSQVSNWWCLNNRSFY